MAATEENENLPIHSPPQLSSNPSHSPSPSPLTENGNPKFPIFEALSSDQTSAFSNLLLPPSPWPLTDNGNPKFPNCEALSSIQALSTHKSIRRSPRLLLDNGNTNGAEENSRNPNKRPAKKRKKGKSTDTVSFFVGDPVPDEEARQRWPWRYGLKVHFQDLGCIILEFLEFHGGFCFYLFRNCVFFLPLNAELD